jgi:hypothetical protein
MPGDLVVRRMIMFTTSTDVGGLSASEGLHADLTGDLIPAASVRRGVSSCHQLADSGDREA